MTLPDKDTFNTFGGPKNNYAAVEDATTDRDATMANYAYCDTAMMSRMIPRAWTTLVTAGTGAPTLATTNPWEAVWKQATTTAPALARTAVGTYTITWPTLVNDEGTMLGAPPQSHAINFVHANGWAESGTTAVQVQCVVTAGNIITVYAFNPTTGALIDTTGVLLVVEGFF